MLDTFNFTYKHFIDYHKVGYQLDRCKSTYKGVKGKYGNYIVYANSHKIEFKGSIAKLYNGGKNFFGLPMEAVKETITLLSYVFDYNLFEAEVKRPDIGTSFATKEAPKRYRANFTYKPNYFRNDYKDSTYYHTNTNNKVLIFYDKCKVNNFLKYEYRIKDNRTLKQALKLNHKPTVADVINNNNLLLKQWKNAYFTVRKSQLVTMTSIPNGVKDITNFALALAVNNPQQRQSIEDAIKLNPCKKKKYEMRQKLRSAEKYRFNSNYDLIKELDTLVNEVCESYLI